MFTEEGDTVKRKADETWTTEGRRDHASLNPPHPTHSFPLPAQEAVSPDTL